MKRVGLSPDNAQRNTWRSKYRFTVKMATNTMRAYMIIQETPQEMR